MTCPNYDLDLELRVLETLMHYGNHNEPSVQRAMLTLTSDCFYICNHGILFVMIRECFQKQDVFGFVDILGLIPRDNKDLYMLMQWIIENYTKFPLGAKSLERDSARLLLMSKLRKQVTLAEKMIVEVKDCRDPQEAHEILTKRVNDISNLNYHESKEGISNIDLAEMFYDGQLEKDLILRTTCEQLNKALNGGIMAKSLITVAGGAGGGKTGFSIFLLDCIARNQPNSHSLFFSLEMEAKHIWMRHVGIRGRKQFDILTEQERLNSVASVLEVPMKIYDAATSRNCADIDFIVTTSRLKAQEKPISVIVVDYLGLVQNSGKFERNDLKQADITSKLANIAMELNCVVIALSQINRGAANRSKDDQCPWPHDAADSSGSHRSSTLWLGIDRPELYQDDPCYRNQFVIKCRKNRFGENFELTLAFNEGTFAEVPHGWFKKPLASIKNPEKAIFSAHSDDFCGWNASR